MTGKGGVGKTTIAAALGREFARRGQKTLVVSSLGAAQLSRVVRRPLTTRAERLADNFYVALIDPEEAMREYVEAALGSRFVADAIFHPRFSRGFLHGIPGLRAWALLGKAWYYTTTERGGPPLLHAPFDTVILDAPATGDSTDLLRVPKVVGELAPFGRLKKDAEDCWAMLRDPRQSAVVPVTLPEELPVTETLELAQVVRSDLGLPLGPVVVNQWSPQLLSNVAQARLSELDAEQVGSAVRSLVLSGQRRALREQGEEREAARLLALGLELLRVPRLETPPLGLEGLEAVAAYLGAAFQKDPRDAG